jgi:hypothetical protein
MSSALTWPHDASFRTPVPTVQPSHAVGEESILISKRLRGMMRSEPQQSIQAAESLPERLFRASAELKVLISQVSMHLPEAWRLQVFRQLDGLYDAEARDDTDPLIDPRSFMTFLRTILFHRPLGRPGLGIGPSGALLLGWVQDRDTLTIEFLPLDMLRWAVVRRIGDNVESATGKTSLRRLLDVLRPYQPERWFAPSA